LEDDETIKLLKMLGIKVNSVIQDNIIHIVMNYPNVVESFIENLNDFIKDMSNITISDPHEYIGELNSDYWELGNALYKENDLNKYNELKSNIELKNIYKEKTFEKIKADIIEHSKLLKQVLNTYLFAYYNGIENLQDVTIKSIMQTLNISKDELQKRTSNTKNDKMR